MHKHFGRAIQFVPKNLKRLECGSQRTTRCSVVGPHGETITFIDLPAPHQTKRWSAIKRARVIAAVMGGMVTLREVLDWYALTESEYINWRDDFLLNGLHGSSQNSSRVREPPRTQVLAHRHCVTQLDTLTDDKATMDCETERTHVIKCGALEITDGAIFSNGSRVSLSATPFRMMRILALNNGVPLRRHFLMQKLYDGNQRPSLKIIDVMVCTVRKKLRTIGAEGYLQTVWGRGVRLSPPDES